MTELFTRRRRGSPALRRGSRLATILGLVLLASTVFAPAALAHHPEITASVDCDGVVSFTSTAWETSEDFRRVNNDIDIIIQTGPSQNGPWSPEDTLSDPAYRFWANNDYSFSDSYQLSGELPAYVRVTAKPQVPWGENQNINGTDGRSTVVATPTDCETPAQPDASLVHDCEAVTITLENNADADTGLPVTFVIERDGAEVERVEVLAGRSVPKVYDARPNQAVTWTVTAIGFDQVFVDQTFTEPCETAAVPRAEIVHDCEAVRVTVANDGDQFAAEVTFTVTSSEGAEDTITLGGGESEEFTYPALPNQEVTYTVTIGDGQVLESWTFTEECETEAVPQASITHDCEAVQVTVSNGGDQFAAPVTFTVERGDETLDTVTLGGGGSETFTYPASPNQQVTYTVTAGEEEILSETFTEACETPAAPAASIVGDCDGIVITLTNGGDANAGTVTFDIYKDGAPLESVAVTAAEGTATRTYDVDEDQEVSYEVRVDDVALDSAVFEFDCVQVAPTVIERSATIEHSCTTDVVITMRNRSSTNTEPLTFTVRKDGGAVEDVVLAAGESATRTYVMAEDETATWSVTSGTTTVASRTITEDCVQVLPTIVERPPAPAPAAAAQLPATGTDAATLAAIALALLLAGSVLLRRQHEAAAVSQLASWTAKRPTTLATTPRPLELRRERQGRGASARARWTGGRWSGQTGPPIWSG